VLSTTKTVGTGDGAKCSSRILYGLAVMWSARKFSAREIHWFFSHEKSRARTDRRSRVTKRTWSPMCCAWIAADPKALWSVIETLPGAMRLSAPTEPLPPAIACSTSSWPASMTRCPRSQRIADRVDTIQDTAWSGSTPVVKSQACPDREPQNVCGSFGVAAKHCRPWKPISMTPGQLPAPHSAGCEVKVAG
jgi:hypothetical protein